MNLLISKLIIRIKLFKKNIIQTKIHINIKIKIIFFFVLFEPTHIYVFIVFKFEFF